MVRIDPHARSVVEERESVTIPMRCMSEGAVDVYIEPRLPKARLLLAGDTPVAHALARIGPALNFSVVRFVAAGELRDVQTSGGERVFAVEWLGDYLADFDEHLKARSAAVVASQGHYDDEALEALLRCGLGYVGLLASRKRGAAVLGSIAKDGIPPERRAAVHIPAGLAIGARKPAQVAVSILAEIVQSAAERRMPDAAAQSEPACAIDPICGMDVEIASARHRAAFEGAEYFFCSSHCRAAFEAEPLRFLASPAAP